MLEIFLVIDYLQSSIIIYVHPYDHVDKLGVAKTLVHSV